MEIKIPFYNILNMFLTGLVFLGGCLIIYPIQAMDFMQSEIIKSLTESSDVFTIVCAVAVAYEVGLIINRIGSVVIAPLLKLLKVIPFNNNYVLFNERKKEYPIMNTLSREYALARTSVALFLMLFVLSIIALKWIIAIVCILITTIYCVSCRKHSAKIVELMKE